MKKLHIIILLLLSSSVSTIFAQNYNREVVKGKLIVKLKSDYAQAISNGKFNNQAIQQIIAKDKVASLQKKYPRHTSPSTEKNKYQQPLTDLSLIYELSFSQTIPQDKLAKQLVSSNVFEYIEPVYTYHLLTDSLNDPGYHLQYHLENIKALLAFEVEKGDTNVVIGISDTGTDLAHPDLKGNTKYNYADPIDGVDNDLDGYIDNFMGWDLSENDNNPQFDTHIHGIHVSGIADAVTDNGIGIAGVGNRCKFLPLKILNHDDVINAGFESIVYAADHGCAVVNCSWGGTGKPSKYEQDIVNYATFNQNCLVVASAGNSGVEEIYYPASYDNVISVAATDKNDLKWGAGTTGGSTYNCGVDISAPGNSIYSTLSNGTYGNSSGTSMAAPIVSGAAALVKSRFPYLSALQIGEQLKSTADNIDNINPPQYSGKLGHGRVNLFNAVTDTTKTALVVTSKTISDHGDGIYLVGDTLYISCEITNYLANATGVTAILSSSSGQASVVVNNFAFGTINTNQTKNNSSAPFKVKLIGTLGSNHPLNFTLSLFATNFFSKECFQITVNHDYILCDANNLKTTFTSKSNLAYNDPYQLVGYGVSYKSNDNILSNAGLMIGNSTAQVSNNLLSSTLGEYDFDFASKARISKKTTGAISDFDLIGTFDDSYAGALKQSLEVVQSSYAWKDAPNDNFIIVNYKIYNKGITPLGSVYVGLFMDWDILDYGLNKASWHEASKTIYSYSSQPGSMYAGTKLLNHLELENHYAMDNIDANGFGVNMADGFTKSEKYIVLSNNRDNAGVNGAGNDVATVASVGPFFIDVSDTINVSIALLAGDSLATLIRAANQSQTMYNQHLVGLENRAQAKSDIHIYPNPAQNELFISTDKSIKKVEILDLTGKIIYSHHQLLSGSISLNTVVSGTYLVKVYTDNGIIVKKIAIVR